MGIFDLQKLAKKISAKRGWILELKKPDDLVSITGLLQLTWIEYLPDNLSSIAGTVFIFQESNWSHKTS